MKQRFLLFAAFLVSSFMLQAQTKMMTVHTPAGPISIPLVLVDSMTMDVDETFVPVEPLTPQPDNVEMGNYTVIMLMQPGNNDCQTVADMIEMIGMHELGMIDSTIHVVGLLKPSPMFQRMSGLDYCFKFDLAKMGVPEEVLKQMSQLDPDSFEPSDETNSAALYSLMKGSVAYRNFVYPYLKTTKWCNADEDIDNAETIAALIKQAVAEHPAKHYVFILYGHGSGYDPVTDPNNPDAYTTDATDAARTQRRICLPDVNTRKKGIALDEFMLGIKKSGVKFQTLLTQCCLMASLENMTAYSHQFDYFLGSQEVTRGGYFPRFIANLSGVEGNDEALRKSFTNLVDYYVGLVEQMNSKKYEFASSYGWYDLHKLPTLLTTIKKAADWFIDANQKDTLFMRDVMLGANYSTEAFEGKERFREEIDEYRDLFLHPERHQYVDEETVHKALVAMLEATTTNLQLDFVFSTILMAGLQQNPAEHPALDFSALESIYDEYIANLQDMAYINCDKGQLDEADDPYLYTSPSVQLFNFNPDFYIPYLNVDAKTEVELYEKTTGVAHTLWTYIAGGSPDIAHELSIFYRGNPYAVELERAMIKGDSDAMKLYSVDNISSTYCGTRFSQATGWGNLLMQTTYNPNLLWNPVRTTKKDVEESLPYPDDDPNLDPSDGPDDHDGDINDGGPDNTETR